MFTSTNELIQEDEMDLMSQLIIIDSKSHMGFRPVQKPMTLNNLERLKRIRNRR